MKKLLLFDIDYTLVNTDVFRPYWEKEGRWDEVGMPFEDAVYPEVKGVLDELSENYRLGILSQFEVRNYQLAKLVAGGLIEFFEPGLIYLVRSKEEEIADVAGDIESTKVWIIDDRVDHLQIVKNAMPNAQTVLVRRGRYVNMKSRYFPDETISDLGELRKILNH